MTRTESVQQVEARALEIIRQEFAGDIDHQDIRNWLKTSSDHLELAALHVVAACIGVTETSH